jgi:uncharacterized membrane protein YcfT
LTRAATPGEGGTGRAGPRARLPAINRAKGLGILLVVLGHLATGAPQPGAEWYFELKATLYEFHMPFFMAISGFVGFYGYRPVADLDGYRAYVLRKAVRLAPGFLLLTGLVLGGKALAQQVIPVDNPVTSLEDLLLPLLMPQRSPVGFVWYIYVLAEIYLLLPLLLAATGQRPDRALLPLAVLHFLPLTPLFALDLLGQHLVFFFAGAAGAQHWPRSRARLGGSGPLWVLLFALLLLAHQKLWLPQLVLAAAAIPALFYLVADGPLSRADLLQRLGVHAYVIYLFSMPAIGLTKGLLFACLGLGYAELHLLLPVLLLAGTGVPVLLKRALLVRVPLLDRITT